MALDSNMSQFMFSTNFILRAALTVFISISINRLAFSQKQNTAPNIILILSDDHSVPYLGAYGHPDVKTPNIDRLAKEGIRFNHAYTTAPQCTPSRASILTGRSPVDIRMTRFAAPLP